MINPSIFREYDIRGIAEKDFSDAVVNQIGRAYASFMLMRGHKRIAVGHDLRESSPRLSGGFIEALLQSGLDVVNVGQVTTPALYFAILHYQTDGGVMITGSHNPIEFNGFKLNENMRSIYGEDIQTLRDIILANGFEQRESGAEERMDVIPAYLNMLKSKFDFKKKLKIVIDAGNATAGPIAPQLWRDLGHEVIELYCEPDGRFPNHLPDPTVPKYMKDLQIEVLKHGADVGIGYDGDSDRVGAVDDKGRLIFADTLMALFAKDVLTKNPRAEIYFDVKCSMALPRQIEKYGGKPVMWKTGHSVLKAKMKAEGSPFSGELSGHLFFADDFFGFDDGIYASGRLLQMIDNENKPLSALVDEVPSYPSTPEIRVDCADEKKFDIVQNLVDDFKNEHVIDIDGARVEFDDGWGLVRASNTQPVLVLRFEAETETRLVEIVELFKERLRQYPDVHFTDDQFEL